MDQNNIFYSLIPEDIFTTNRLPTDEEREIIQQSVSLFNVKLQDMGTQISSLRLQIREVKAQVAQMEGELKRLCNEEAAVTKACAPHRLALSPFRTLPDDVLREICTACVDDKEYPITTSASAAPRTLARISSRMRRIALTTPNIWASVQINFRQNRSCTRATNEYFQRAGGLALNISMKSETNSYITEFGPVDISKELFDLLFSYSTRWREITFHFASSSGWPLTRIAALKATDAPLLRSLSLTFGVRTDASAFHHSTILSIPTLKCLYLDITRRDISEFSVSWANLTVLHIIGQPWHAQNAVSCVANILRQTTHLVNCSINIGSVTEIGYSGEIFLPCLQSLSVAELLPRDTPEVPGLLKFINAPVLQVLDISDTFSTNSLSTLFQRAPALQYLKLELSPGDADCFTRLKQLLRYCPSLLSLVIKEPGGYRLRVTSLDELLNAFVRADENGYLCPLLHTFIFNWGVDAPLDCIRRFLTGKRKGHGIAGLNNWIKVVLTLNERRDSWPQIRELIAEQRAAGLDVSLQQPAYTPFDPRRIALR